MTPRSPINFRTFLIVAVCMILSVFCAYVYIFIRALGIVSAVVLFCGLAACAAVWIVRYVRKKSRLSIGITFALATVLCISAFAFAVSYADMRKEYEEFGGYSQISGRICSIDLRDGEYTFYIENIELDGNSVHGKMRVTVADSDRNNAEFADIGDIVTFSAYVTVYPLAHDGSINGSSYRTGIIFSSYADGEELKVSFGSPSPLDKFLHGWHEMLVQNMGERYGNIAFSMLTGDKYGLDDDIFDMFSAAGLGHIMAVSGLHIGFLIMLVDLLLSRVDKRIRFPIIAVLLAAYVVIADFSPSVVRAAIMALIAGSAVFVGGRRDLLSSLCCAFSLILAIKPLYLFEIGFLMSFCALFGIAMFSDTIAWFFKRHGAHRKVADGIGSAVSVQAGIMPAQIYFFHTVQPLAAIVNIVLLPYISAVFMLLVCCSVVGAIPYCGIVLKLPMYLLVPIDLITRGISAIPYSSMDVFSTAAIFLCYPVMFFASEYFMIPKGKPAVVAYSLAACLAFCFVCAPVRGDFIAAASYGTSAESLVCIGDEAYYIGYVDSEYAARRMLETYRRSRLDGIFLLGIHKRTADNVISLCDSVKTDAVYYIAFDTDCERMIDGGVNFRMISASDDTAFAPIMFGGRFAGYEYGDILFAANGADERIFGDYSVVRTKTVSEPLDGTVYLCNYADVERGNVFTLGGGGYEYRLAADT